MTECEHKRVASFGGKSSDCNSFSFDGKECDGYVPENVGIGGGDYVEFDYCLDCGQILSKDFPVKQETLDKLFEEEEY